jgi:hypothetical protein
MLWWTKTASWLTLQEFRFEARRLTYDQKLIKSEEMSRDNILKRALDRLRWKWCYSCSWECGSYFSISPEKGSSWVWYSVDKIVSKGNDFDNYNDEQDNRKVKRFLNSSSRRSGFVEQEQEETEPKIKLVNLKKDASSRILRRVYGL